MLTLACAIPVFTRNVDSFAFFIASPDLGWGLFYVFTGFLLCSFFLFALFASGTASIFAGEQGYRQSVWNCAVYSLFSLSLFTTILLLTGITEEEKEILTICQIALFLLILYCLVIFLCLKNSESFCVKNILSKDSNSKLCIKVYIFMIIVVEVISFLLAHKFTD